MTLAKIGLDRITHVLTICYVKLTQSTVLQQKHFDVRSLSPALHKLWLLLVYYYDSRKERLSAVSEMETLWYFL